jgi:hypothetical protein
MEPLILILLLLLGFVIIMNRRPDWWSQLTHWLHIRTSILKPEVSICELIILILVLLIVFKIYL